MNPTGNRNRSDQMTIVHEKSGGVGVSDGEGVLDKGRETKLGKDSGKIRVGDPVVSFFLIKEDDVTMSGRVLVLSLRNLKHKNNGWLDQ